ncbi:uncharacterized protein LOC117117601 [Anneissia japonica]|uniref:uncharacterized protein LOC117117601 n=1 Tax=Anneissia japonica TaxID=1529436 RepID=UPI0014255871|nr:uncharacterized protein LOC117117601 [Anneissia japonica]
MKRLLRMDSTAIRVRWEVLPDKDGKEDTKSELQIDGNDWKQIFEEVSSSENEEGEEDVNIMEVGDSQQGMEEFKVQNVTAALKGLEAAVDQDNTITEDSMQHESKFSPAPFHQPPLQFYTPRYTTGDITTCDTPLLLRI